jgi:hypothetical protein
MEALPRRRAKGLQECGKRPDPIEHNIAEVETDLDSLGDEVYQLGVFMMTKLRDGDVGCKAPKHVGVGESHAEVQVLRIPGASGHPQLVLSVKSPTGPS